MRKSAGESESDDEFVRGRLIRRIQFWQSIGAAPWVLNVLKNGYKLPFVSLPAGKRLKNHTGAYTHANFVRAAIAQLLQTGCAREVDQEEVMVSSPLSVVDNGRKVRLILDLRYVNAHLAKHCFHLDDLRTLVELFRKGTT